MNLYEEYVIGGRKTRTWNYSHPSGFAGEVSETYDRSGQLFSRIYRVSGSMHRPARDGPAFQSWHDNGTLCHQAYCFHGKLERPIEDGPAQTSWDHYGKIVAQTFWENGKKALNESI